MDRLIGNEETIKKHIMVLNILSSYTRSFPPSKDEFQIYLEATIDNNKLKELIEVSFIIYIYIYIFFFFFLFFLLYFYFIYL